MPLQPLAIGIIGLVATAAFVVGKRLQESMEDSGPGPKIFIVLVSMSWCKHCKAYEASGTFDMVGNEAESRSGGAVKFVTWRDKPREQLAKYPIVESFPTIMAIKAGSGQVLGKFSGDRNDASALLRYALSLA